ncbi:hypothetical protein H5410_031166 [Solanum commersonii]|uniref:Uncharacterized protein n=1 Tax=Solanum commersonii TaxID=4109 RepID=A0A9J5YKW2_SOLCO|nr:hypothetical protein H5410_031166 [Solanum commersonii]
MEDHTDMTERRENLVNHMIRGPRENQNENNFVTKNRYGGSFGDELNTPHGFHQRGINTMSIKFKSLIVFKENSHPDKKTRLELTIQFS